MTENMECFLCLRKQNVTKKFPWYAANNMSLIRYIDLPIQSAGKRILCTHWANISRYQQCLSSHYEHEWCRGRKCHTKTPQQPQLLSKKIYDILVSKKTNTLIQGHQRLCLKNPIINWSVYLYHIALLMWNKYKANFGNYIVYNIHVMLLRYIWLWFYRQA